MSDHQGKGPPTNEGRVEKKHLPAGREQDCHATATANERSNQEDDGQMKRVAEQGGQPDRSDRACPGLPSLDCRSPV